MCLHMHLYIFICVCLFKYIYTVYVCIYYSYCIAVFHLAPPVQKSHLLPCGTVYMFFKYKYIAN